MRMTFPHSLGREEVRRRVREHEGEIAQIAPAGMAEVTTSWPSEDKMALSVTAMGKTIEGCVDISDDALAFEFDLPMALSFVGPMIRSAIEPKAKKLLGQA
ncbi:polyhydroxyalkanoic acid system family protein [Novosphingobium sp.]|uniref:polyhydroxyalkanoic acid system family protein n=1 Tax=Novosphingobium sp. TaxID=1874826 RepID=UPI0035AF5241